MSGHGAPDQRPGDASDLSVAVVAASWHDVVMDGLLAGTHREDDLALAPPGAWDGSTVEVVMPSDELVELSGMGLHLMDAARGPAGHGRQPAGDARHRL